MKLWKAWSIRSMRTDNCLICHRLFVCLSLITIAIDQEAAPTLGEHAIPRPTPSPGPVRGRGWGMLRGARADVILSLSHVRGPFSNTHRLSQLRH